ncbi:uncharacterized protein BT62DRAFT_924526 [Guyanagaster necrorhizus]|uniref:Uncharacterized protein n=1 Tax=Guyanagaster necrorhizus TaxID=856835 RepID=A0A9P8ALE1_9AGAR|nr:uncharacterized protein BT62DRAFT_924526 [Guyanagaster necrorhizus MCA 3950]KAG7439700.1 hypothetical protein BT62DRAFT_924526 [Guyanagaster necrorhizus MCA 3950]
MFESDQVHVPFKNKQEPKARTFWIGNRTQGGPTNTSIEMTTRSSGIVLTTRITGLLRLQKPGSVHYLQEIRMRGKYFSSLELKEGVSTIRLHFSSSPNADDIRKLSRFHNSGAVRPIKKGNSENRCGFVSPWQRTGETQYEEGYLVASHPFRVTDNSAVSTNQRHNCVLAMRPGFYTLRKFDSSQMTHKRRRN